MRQVILQFLVSLDGYSCDQDNGLRDVMQDMDDPEEEKYALGRLWQAGTHIMGRVTYDGMASFWPGSSLPAGRPHERHPQGCPSQYITGLCESAEDGGSGRRGLGGPGLVPGGADQAPEFLT
jgi:hypothetical protein